MLFSILIPTTPERRTLLARLMTELDKQRAGHECIIIQYETPTEKNGGPTTGAKRNALIDEAIAQGATHVAFFDSDDLPGPNYVKRCMEAVEGDYDCAELWGQYYENGKQLNPFHHSIVHDHWWQDSKFYYRNPNHLNVMKLDLIKDIRFKDITVGEDGNFSIDLQKAGVLKREYPIKEIIYHYFAGGKKNHKLEPLMLQRRGISLH